MRSGSKTGPISEVSMDHEGSFFSLPFFPPHRLIFVINLLCEIWELLPWNAGEDFSRLFPPVKNGLCHQWLREDTGLCRYMNQQGARWCTQETRSVPLNTGYKQCEPPFPHLYSEWGQLKVILVPFTLDSTRMNSRHSEYLQTGPRRNNHRNVVSCFPGMAGISMSGADISTFAMWPPPLYIHTHTHTHTHTELLKVSLFFFLALDLLFLSWVWNCCTKIHPALGSVAHLVPAIAWSNWSTEFKWLLLKCYRNVERNRQGDCGPAFSTLVGHLLTPVSPSHPCCSAGHPEVKEFPK